MKLKSLWVAAAAACALASAAPVLSKTRSDATFAFPKDRPVKIVLFRPDVEVGTLGMSSVPTPNADWTAQARKNFADALTVNQNARQNQIVFLDQVEGEDGAYLAEYQSLYRAVGAAMLLHSSFVKLPSKKNPDGTRKFDWTLGPGAQRLGAIGGNADYGLFLFSYDAFATTSRAIFGWLGVGTPFGAHSSSAALVDFKSGNIVWFNFYINKKGDPRTPEGASERVTKLLSTLPLREGDVQPKAVAGRK